MATTNQWKGLHVFESINEWANGLNIQTERYKEKVERLLESTQELDDYNDILIKHALENIDEADTDWTYFAARIYLQSLYQKAAESRNYDQSLGYGSFYHLITDLTEKGIYSSKLITKYTKEEIDYFDQLLDQKRDLLFTYPGIYTLATRYLAVDHEKNVYELPQERWMVIAMYLMQDEDLSNRTEHVREAYWALSHLYMTVATPTLANAGKNHGQLSSCFIDTVGDSLQGIYDSNTDIAQLSKNGGGIGVYMGKVRARGSSIKGFKEMSSGVVPWIKQLNNTAVSVDQLGTRKGAISVYLDVWHRDIEEFLDLKLNNGDDRLRAHDVYTGICVPDLFMEQVEKRGDWYLLDRKSVV